jgi:F0F1-type ATP synthase assembly protein I
MDTKLVGIVIGGGGVIAATFFLMTALGLFIDRQLGTTPWGIALGMILAFISVGSLLYHFYKKMNDKK